MGTDITIVTNNYRTVDCIEHFMDFFYLLLNSSL